jgi:hypothetical protein
MSIRLVVPARLTVGQIIKFEEGYKTTKEAVEMLIPFARNGAGDETPLDPQRAREAFYDLTVDELAALVEDFAQQAKERTASPLAATKKGRSSPR